MSGCTTWRTRSVLLRSLGVGGTAEDVAGSGKVVYLAEATSDLGQERDCIRRELLERGHEVLPDRPLPAGGGGSARAGE
jgi:hypothetical protein